MQTKKLAQTWKGMSIKKLVIVHSMLTGNSSMYQPPHVHWGLGSLCFYYSASWASTWGVYRYFSLNTSTKEPSSFPQISINT